MNSNECCCVGYFSMVGICEEDEEEDVGGKNNIKTETCFTFNI